MSDLKDNAEYKYLGILEMNDFKPEKMRAILKKEYFSRLSKQLKTRLNSGNLFSANSTWTVSVFLYGAEILKWKKAELQKVDRHTHTQTTHHLQENAAEI